MAAAAIAAADWVHVDQAGGQAAHALPHRLLSVDGGDSIPGYRPAATALYGPTVEQLRALFGTHAPASLLRMALAAGARCVVATDGGNGTLCASGRDAWRIPALPDPVVSTLGADDVFHGALLAATVRGFDLPTCTAYANIAAPCPAAASTAGRASPATTRSWRFCHPCIPFHWS